MARIHIDNDDSLPDLADLLKGTRIKQSPRKKIQRGDVSQPQPRSRQASDSLRFSSGSLPPSDSVPRTYGSLPRRKASDSRQLDTSDECRTARRRNEAEDEKATKPRQRVLKKVENNARLGSGSASKEGVRLTIGENDGDKKVLPSRTPRRVAKPTVQQIAFFDDEDAENEVEKKEEYDSDDSLPSPSKLFRKPRLFGVELDESARGLKEPSLKLGKVLIPSLPSSAVVSKESLVLKTQPVLPTTSRPTSSSDNDKSAFLI